MVQQTKAVDTKDLSAPELLVLLNPAVEAPEALKVGVKELMAVGLVHLGKISRRGWLGFKVSSTNLHLSPGERPKNLVLYGLLGDLRSALRHDPEVGQVLQQLRREYGSNYEQFKQKIILPGLLRLGLLESQSQEGMGWFKTTRYRHTAAGLAQKEQLEDQMAQARQIARLLRDDPPQVVALMAHLGSAAILVPELWPYFGEINALIARQDDGGGSLIPIFGAGSHDPDPSKASYDSLDQAFAGLDSSFDASGGDSDGSGGE
jgi:hypothetical protein